jgi:hypothetical protein
MSVTIATTAHAGNGDHGLAALVRRGTEALRGWGLHVPYAEVPLDIGQPGSHGHADSRREG